MIEIRSMASGAMDPSQRRRAKVSFSAPWRMNVTGLRRHRQSRTGFGGADQRRSKPFEARLAPVETSERGDHSGSRLLSHALNEAAASGTRVRLAGWSLGSKPKR